MDIWYPTFRGWFLPPQIHFGQWARQKKYVSLGFSSTTTYMRPKKMGGGYLPNVACQWSEQSTGNRKTWARIPAWSNASFSTERLKIL